MSCIAETKNNNLALNVYVQPKASKNRIAGMHGSAIKVCVTAPPAENRANEAVLGIVAELFEVPKSSVSIKSGRQGRNKKVIIQGLALGDAQTILARELPKT